MDAVFYQTKAFGFGQKECNVNSLGFDIVTGH